nr:hypothetical protein CFP56_71865 [Quercus suber]
MHFEGTKSSGEAGHSENKRIMAAIEDLQCSQISSFTRLVEAARRTSMSVRKPSKGSTSQVMSTPRQSWRRENKKVEVAVVEEPKKGVKGKKRERGGIPPPFTMSIEKLYSILEAWLKDGVVVLLECKREPQKKKSKILFIVGITGDVITIPRIAML